MQIDTIRIFCDLVELKNFSRTAEKHGLSQSAISQQLAQLEMDHNCQLINRKTRPLTLTEQGQCFYHACQDILDRYDKLVSELKNLSRSHTTIRFAAIFSIGMHTLQPYVKRFMARFPQINLRIDYMDAKQIYDGILRGDLDLGAVAVPIESRSLNLVPFVDEPLVMVCSPDNPLAKEPVIDIHKLQGKDFIAFEKGLPSRKFIDNILDRYDVMPKTVMEFDNIETIKRAVEINSGISILPETTINTELREQKLATIAFTNENFFRPTGIIVRKNRSTTKAMKYLLELLGNGQVRNHANKSRNI
ncbi:CysJI operon transcriptional activator [Anaerohalosphaera lusitana]|uniref:CysJI operon transcriptional activator n=1 Tax=Anaerohalosphaera lusitana TaxID=1936003 RepID=A0A1U9NLE7_9BACT|nr:LysR family transcriptional regulator [Anaerohalosphaera lusitana]AQT68564.1 CysJI operon transcriptional activator [Anaerohalosphaera lusitana]